MSVALSGRASERTTPRTDVRTYGRTDGRAGLWRLSARVGGARHPTNARRSEHRQQTNNTNYSAGVDGPMEESPKIRASVAGTAHSLSHIHGLHTREYERRRQTVQYNTAQRSRRQSAAERSSISAIERGAARERAGGQPTNRTAARGRPPPRHRPPVAWPPSTARARHRWPTTCQSLGALCALSTGLASLRDYTARLRHSVDGTHTTCWGTLCTVGGRSVL